MPLHAKWVKSGREERGSEGIEGDRDEEAEGEREDEVCITEERSKFGVKLHRSVPDLFQNRKPHSLCVAHKFTKYNEKQLSETTCYVFLKNRQKSLVFSLLQHDFPNWHNSL